MPRFTKEQKDWAYRVLGVGQHEHSPHVQAWSPEGPTGDQTLLSQLKARVITGEELSSVDLLNAKNTLSAAEQAELATFLKEK
jgi:hypothetical protein